MTPWEEFEALRQMRGAAYERLREVILRTTPDLSLRLARYNNDPDWYRWTQAKILEGWVNHGALYAQILTELDKVDVGQESRTVVGISRIWDAYALEARTQYKKTILPLCWEAMLHYSGVWPDWKMVTFLRMLAVVPSEYSIEPVLYFMEQSSDLGVLDIAGRVIELLPPAVTKPAVAAHLHAAEMKAQSDPSIGTKTQYLRNVWHKVLSKLP